MFLEYPDPLILCSGEGFKFFVSMCTLVCMLLGTEVTGEIQTPLDRKRHRA